MPSKTRVVLGEDNLLNSYVFRLWFTILGIIAIDCHRLYDFGHGQRRTLRALEL